MASETASPAGSPVSEMMKRMDAMAKKQAALEAELVHLHGIQDTTAALPSGKARNALKAGNARNRALEVSAITFTTQVEELTHL
jgi:hypothetical protein